MRKNPFLYCWNFIGSKDPYSQSSGRPRQLQSRTDNEITFKSGPSDEWGFAQPQNFFKNSYMMENSKQLLSAILWYRKFGSHLWWCSIFYEMIAGSVFCEVLHSEASCRKRDSTHQDVTFRRCFVTFGRKKCEAEARAWYASRCDIFKKTFHCLWWKKKVTQELLPYTGENVSAPSCLHGKVTDRGYL